MNIEELDNKIQIFIDEMRESYKVISTNQLMLSQRLDSLDLNGSAVHLREFGVFLKDHPDFMKREATQESKRVQQEIAVSWLKDKFHLNNLGNKVKWVGTALLTGVLLTFGSYLVSFMSEINTVFHALGHAMFK